MGNDTISYCPLYGQQDSFKPVCKLVMQTNHKPKFDVTDQTIESVMTDNSKMQEIVGPAQVAWKDGLRRMVEDRHPDWLVG